MLNLFAELVLSIFRALQMGTFILSALQMRYQRLREVSYPEVTQPGHRKWETRIGFYSIA